MKHEKFLHLKPEGGLSLTHGSLFSGIGGFDLAAEWMGWENIFHCEWNPFGQRVLKHYWPNAISYHDITKTDFTIHRGNIDILTGGFPCQPYSSAGKRKGKEDDRHLWPEMLRAVGEIRPTYVVGENVFGLVNWNRGLVFNEVQTDLEAQGYEVFPYVLPACSVGAPHRRDRVWFVAHAISSAAGPSRKSNRTESHRSGNNSQPKERGEQTEQYIGCDDVLRDDSNTNGTAIPEKTKGRKINSQERKEVREKHSTVCQSNQWRDFPTQSPVCGGDDGLPSELDGITFSKWKQESIKAFGNAIVPQVAFELFRAVGVLNAKTLHETSL